MVDGLLLATAACQMFDPVGPFFTHYFYFTSPLLAGRALSVHWSISKTWPPSAFSPFFSLCFGRHSLSSRKNQTVDRPTLKVQLQKTHPIHLRLVIASLETGSSSRKVNPDHFGCRNSLCRQFENWAI